MATTFIDPKTGARFDVGDGAEAGAAGYGLIPLEQHEREQRSGGLYNEIGTGIEEVERQAVSAAALLPGSGELDAMGNPVTTTEGTTARAAAPSLFSPAALERRETNPTAAMVGATVPLVAAGLVAPEGLGMAAALDIGAGAAQEATDAEVEDRGITGEHVLRNAGLNLLFTGAAHGLSAGARKAVQGTYDILDHAAAALKSARTTKAAASEGAELAEAAAEPEVRDELLSAIASKTDKAVSAADRALDSVAAPRIANNPAAQAQAVETIGDAFEKSYPSLVDELRRQGGSGVSASERFEALQVARSAAEPGGDLEQALTSALGREDLWGAAAMSHATDVEAAKALRPPPGAGPDQIRAYTDAVRKVRAGELGGYADDIDHLTDRAQQIKIAPELGGAPGAKPVAKAVDYEAAMRMSPTEAWQFKQGGGVEGTRKLAAHSIADAFDSVNDGLKQDVAMAVKRENWVEGAKNWGEGIREKQLAYGERVFEQGADLLRFAEQSRGADAASGFNLGGFSTEVRNILQPTLDRVAGLGSSLEDSITRNHELDFLKRALDGVENKLTASKTVNEASQSALSTRLTAFVNDLRNNLQSVELFGQNGSLQKELNQGWVKVIDPYKRVRNNMAEYLGREHGKVGQASPLLTRFDPLDVERVMSGPFNRNLRNDVAAALGGIDEMMKTLQIRGVVHLEGLAKNRGALQRIHDLFQLNDVLRVAGRTAKEPVAEGIARRFAGSESAALAGSLIHGPVGAAVGHAVGAVSREGLDVLGASRGLLKAGGDSAFSRLMRKELGALRDEQKALLGQDAFALGELSPAMQKQMMAASGAGDARVIQLGAAAKQAAELDHKLTARVIINKDAGKRFARTAADTANVFTQFQGDHDSLYQSYQEKRAMLEDFARDPSKMLDIMAEQMGDVGNVSPALHAQMVQQSVRVVSFLQAKMPGRRNVSVVYPNGTPAGAAEVRKFAVYFMAATQPRSVMSELRAGRGRQEQAETLRELWPGEYNSLRASVIEEMGRGHSSPIDRQKMDLFFQLGGSVDPAFGPRVMQLLSNARAKQTRSPTASGSGMARASLPSRQLMQPAGMSSLALGAAIDQKAGAL